MPGPIYGVLMLLDKLTSKKAVDYSRELGRRIGQPAVTLAGTVPGGPAPHATMIHFHAGEDMLPAIREGIAEEVGNERLRGAVKGLFSGVDLWGGSWVFWTMKSNASLRRLHYCSIDIVAKFRGVDLENSASLTPAQQRTRKRYGWAYCGEAWNPHVTLSRLPDGREAAEGLLDGISSGVHDTWVGIELILAEMGPNGTYDPAKRVCTIISLV